jgi:hypothetical protein
MVLMELDLSIQAVAFKDFYNPQIQMVVFSTISQRLDR